MKNAFARFTLPFLILVAAGCRDEGSIPSAIGPNDATEFGVLEKAGQPGGGQSVYYELEFIAESDRGEITSIPVGGVKLNTKDPWRQLSIANVTLTLTSPTHGVRGEGTCIFSDDIDVNWNIATAPERTFAGGWAGDMSIWRDRNGLNLTFAGSRNGDGSGIIDNIASNGNQTEEIRGPNGDYFIARFTNSRLGFGGQSSPDGAGTLADLPGYESACANFTIRATRTP